MISPERSHEILAKLIVSAATVPMSLPSALCETCAKELPMTGAAMVLQSTAGLDRVVAATDGLADRPLRLGLPVGRDMDGYARTDLFQPAFTEDRPITFIPTYDR